MRYCDVITKAVKLSSTMSSGIGSLYTSAFDLIHQSDSIDWDREFGERGPKVKIIMDGHILLSGIDDETREEKLRQVDSYLDEIQREYEKYIRQIEEMKHSQDLEPSE